MKDYDELIIFKCSSCDCEPCIGKEKCQKKIIMQPPPFFNGEYISLRNSCIPEAEKYANSVCGNSRGIEKSEEWAANWNRVYHEKMDELVKKCIRDSVDQWIVGSEECRVYVHAGSWKSAKRWIEKYKAPLRHWIDGRPAFLKSEIDDFLKTHPIEEAA